MINTNDDQYIMITIIMISEKKNYKAVVIAHSFWKVRGLPFVLHAFALRRLCVCVRVCTRNCMYMCVHVYA